MRVEGVEVLDLPEAVVSAFVVLFCFIGAFAALLTSFYSWRLIFLTFFGKPRWNQSEHIQHAVHDNHAHGHDDHSHGHHGHHDDLGAGAHPGDHLFLANASRSRRSDG